MRARSLSDLGVRREGKRGRAQISPAPLSLALSLNGGEGTESLEWTYAVGDTLLQLFDRLCPRTLHLSPSRSASRP